MSRSTSTLVGLLLILTGSSAVAAGPSDPRIERNERGVVLAREGRFDEAHRQFALNLATDPHDVAATNNAANVYLLEARYDRAFDLYDRARDLDPEEGGILLNLGIAHHLAGDRPESLRWLREGLRLIDDPQRAYYLLGLSERPSTTRASDETRLRASEIEALLDAALASVPEDTPDGPEVVVEDAAEDTAKEGDEAPASTEVRTRSAGTRASDATKVEPSRLFWMGLDGN